ncbi:centromere protein J-like isoform X2 [Zootoca vivipara]|uniref:centromere protein J-like isoform X2 n=1 Tax=Zootoca vivipara TaxID=8524 RepID=UPI00293BE8FB|nr:centromere protein J-like isoform X2 [Zootoca vivipara]
MESDIFKRRDCLSQQVVKDSPAQASCHSTTDERTGSSLSLGWASSTNNSFPAQVASFNTSSTLERDVGLPGDLGHLQTFQDAKPFGYTASSILFPHFLPPTQAGTVPAGKNSETLGIPSAAAATYPAPLISQDAICCQNKKQSPGQQEQLIMHQMEHLQRLVAEQQKIISFFNSGFSASAGIPPHLLAMIPSLPGVPAALFPVQSPSENSLQAQNNGSSQTSSLIIKPTLQQLATETSANSNFLEVSREHLEPHKKEASLPGGEPWLETSPPVAEQKGEQQLEENASLSPFGLRMNMKTRNVDDRPIRPGIGVRQKTFEEFVEKQLKVDSQRAEKHQQNSRETKATAQKSFLKRGEGTARLEKKRDSVGKEPAGLPRCVSFDCQNNFSRSKGQVTSPTVLIVDDENTHCITFKGDVKGQLHNCERRSDEIKDSCEFGGRDSKGMVNGKEFGVPPQFDRSKCSQECHEQIIDIKAKVTEKNETSSLGFHDHLVRVDKRSLDFKVPMWLMENIEDSVSQVVGRSMDASPDVRELHNLESNQGNQEEQSSGLQVAQSVTRIRQCENEHCVAEGESPEGQVEVNPGFKKLNDQIVKVTPKSDIKCVTTRANFQKNSNAGAANTREGKPLSSDSLCTSTDSEDEPKSHCSQYAIRPSNHRPANIGKNMDLSDADYATDEPSGADDYSLKNHGKLPASKSGVQEPAGQQEATLITSSSSSNESSVDDGSLKLGKTLSLLRRSSCHPSKTRRGGRKPKTQSNGVASNYSAEYNLQPPSLTSDLVANLFPAFKSKANVDDKRFTPEQVQKRHTDKLECEPEVQVHQRETSLLAQMKEEQAKAMDFLRRQINQFEAKRSQKFHSLEQCKTEEALKSQKEKAEFEKHTTMLKQQIAGLQEEFRRNETRWYAAHGELRSQVAALTKQNLELQDELRVSEQQKMENERKHGAVDLIGRKRETPVSSAILRGTPSEGTLVEKPPQNSHKSPDDKCLGRKIVPPDELAPRDSQATRRALQRSESLKSAAGEQRVKSPCKTVHNRSVTPISHRIPHQTPFGLQKALPQLAHSQQHSYGRKTPVSESEPRALTSPALHVKGTFSSTSGSSEDTAFLNSQSNDSLSAASLSNVGIQVKENPSHKRVQRSNKSSEQVVSMSTSRKNSIASNGRNTPVENLPIFVETKNKASPLKSILSRRASLYTEIKEDGEVKEVIEYPDGKVKQLFTDGRRITKYPNGTKMEISTDKRTTVVTFYNGDIKKILPDQRVIYYYAETQTTRTVFPNGLEVLQFPNNQIEKYHPDGTEEIVFPDQSVKRRYDGGMVEETVFPDGTVVKVEKSGVKTIQFHNGQKEIHMAQSTRREYPDGTVKTVYANGQQETKYSSGRVRIKDEKEIVILDEE